jgi:HK97 family phage major capsid protein
MSKLNEKLQKRAALVTNMRKVLNLADSEKRNLTADETTKYEAYEADILNLDKEIRREQDLEKLEGQINFVPDSQFKPNPNGDAPVNKLATKEYSNAFFNGYMRKGINGMSPDYTNALEVGTNSEGGYLVPQEWAQSLITALPELVVMRRYAEVIVTASDRNIPIETSRGAFTWIDEEGAYGTNDPVFGNIVLSAHKVGGIVKVSEELLQDNVYNLEGRLRQMAMEEFADKEEDAFINGDDSGKPEGVFQTTTVGGVSVTGTTGAVSATAAITFDNIIDTYYGLARKYRTNAAWLASDGHAKLIRKLKDSDGQYLWQPSLVAGEPDRLLNRPFEVSDSAPAPATATRGLCFGDWRYYTIVDRLNMVAQRLNELYAANGQIGFKFHKRIDGGMTLAPAMTFFAHGAAS